MPHGILLKIGARGGRLEWDSKIIDIDIASNKKVVTDVYVINLSFVSNLILPFINV